MRSSEKKTKCCKNRLKQIHFHALARDVQIKEAEISSVRMPPEWEDCKSEHKY